MKIVYSGIQKDNYNPKRGFSFEYNNFYLTLKNMPKVEVIEYPYDPILNVGKKRFNEELLNLVKREKPDLFFAFMFTDELDKNILGEIKKITTSLAWFSDDQWRLYNYSRFYALHFTWIVTTWLRTKALKIYADYGIKNVIQSPCAANLLIWKPLEIKKDIDVSFMGQRTPIRDKIIKELKKKGVNVYVRGGGWSGSERLSQEEACRLISRTKINLDINSPHNLLRLKFIARLFLKKSINKIVLDFWHFFDNLKSWLNMKVPQNKARPFELSACEAFVISGYVDNCEDYYKENEEMVFYRSIDDLIKKINYYLPRKEECQRIAQAGYERTIKEHTYQKRFEEIFKKI